MTDPTAASSDADSIPEARGPSRFPCSACGAELHYSPSQETLRCPYCGSNETIPQGTEAIVEHSFEEALAAGELETIAGLECEVRCIVCGAVILVPSKTVTDVCPYCASAIVNEPTEAAGMYLPESLLPFKLEKRDATRSFRTWLHSLWFAPSDLAKLATEGEIHGLYVPYWTYDSSTVSDYTGMRGDHYWVTVTEQVRDASGNMQTQTRQVRHTRWTSASGRVDHSFDDVLVVASHSLPNDYLQSLEPWNLAELAPFSPAYLSGFQTERYQVDLQGGFQLAQGMMDQKIRQLCLHDIGGDEQSLSSVQTKHFDVTFKHILLPVWHTVYRYRDQPFHIVINARTGEVQGSRPISWWKVAASVLAGTGLAGLIYLAVQLFSQ